jgi:hypothetical protein
MVERNNTGANRTRIVQGTGRANHQEATRGSVTVRSNGGRDNTPRGGVNYWTGYSREFNRVSLAAEHNICHTACIEYDTLRYVKDGSTIPRDGVTSTSGAVHHCGAARDFCRRYAAQSRPPRSCFSLVYKSREEDRDTQ